MATPPDTTPDLRRWLAAHGEGDALSLPYADVQALHDELQRLRQSTDRLRKQNRKVRVKIDRIRASLPVEPEEPEESGSAEPESDSP